MAANLPAITGNQLIKLMDKDGWEKGRKANHGRTMKKRVSDRTIVTFVPESNESLPDGTLAAIIGTKQTRIGRAGFLKLIEMYGIK